MRIALLVRIPQWCSILKTYEEKGRNICQASGNESLSEAKSLNLLNHKKLTSVVFSSKQHFHSLFTLDSIPSSANMCQCACVLGQVQIFATPWTGVWCLTGSSVHGFSRQEYWSGLDSSGKMVYFGAAFKTLFLFLFFSFFFNWETVKRELFFIAPTFLINILLKACFTSLFLRL